MFKILSGGGNVWARYMIVYTFRRYPVLRNKCLDIGYLLKESLRLRDKGMTLSPKHFLCVLKEVPQVNPTKNKFVSD